MEVESYITGFIDGEGCFSISFNKRKRMKTGLDIRPSFSVSQHKRNVEILKKIHEFFGCGAIRFSRTDHTYKYEVRNLKDLRRIIIPHFKKYKLLSSKREDLERFIQICDLMSQSKHFTKEGIEKIIDLASKIDFHSKKKYTTDKLLRVLSKMKV